MTFELRRLRFHYRATQRIALPHAGNVLRGALGALLYPDGAAYDRIFRPQATGTGPSGFADQPRPFVMRAAHLDRAVLEAEASFHFDVHLFDTRNGFRDEVAEAFARLRSARLMTLDDELISIDLAPGQASVCCVRVRFITPTEIKSDQALVMRPEFPILVARLRDRMSTLRALYGEGPLDVDFRGLADRAGAVQLARCELTHTAAQRRSRATGQTHPLGGFTGECEYKGPLNEFLPYLRAGKYTGVGRQTVWGKGEIECEVSS